MTEDEADAVRKQMQSINDWIVELEVESAKNVQQRKLLLLFLADLSRRFDESEGNNA